MPIGGGPIGSAPISGSPQGSGGGATCGYHSWLHWCMGWGSGTQGAAPPGTLGFLYCATPWNKGHFTTGDNRGHFYTEPNKGHVAAENQR